MLTSLADGIRNACDIARRDERKKVVDKACKSFCKVRCASTPCTLKCNSIKAFLKAMEE